MLTETSARDLTEAHHGRGLHAKNLSVRYGGVVANNDVELTVRPGQIVGLIGPNGAGKTTFVDAVTGFTAAEGTITLDGARIDNAPPHVRRRRGLARTWQSGELFRTLTVAENVLVAARTTGWRTLLSDVFGTRHDEHQVDEALELVGLTGARNRLAGDLTLGQQKLVGVARALVGNCGLLLLDEPAAGLDSHESREFETRLHQIADSGPGVLLIDHDMSLVLSVCDVVYVMEFGRIIFSGPPDEARDDPTVVGAYLGAPLEHDDE